MKQEQIYVGINGATLTLTKGKAVAVFPPRKGENGSYMLLESGQAVKVRGTRINGVGVPRYLKENGFALAEPGNVLAARLADLVDIQDGTDLVEAASQTRAAELQRQFAGQACTFVPFDESQTSVSVQVLEPRGSQTISFDLTAAFSSGTVGIAYVPGGRLGSELALSAGWLVGPDGDAGSVPRNTEYGGLVERAVYIICNCGLGTLVGARNLVADDESPVDAPYPRGLLEFALANGDRVQVGSTGCDELEVVYRRAGDVLYSRSGMTNARLGDVIGNIAAVMVRVGEMDARPAKKAKNKAA